MDQQGITMEGEDDMLVLCKKGIKIRIAETMRMFTVRLECHKIYHIDYPDFKFRKVLTQEFDSSQCFQGWHVTATSHNHIRVTTFVVTCPFPYTEPRSAMFNSRIDVHPLQLRLFTCDDDINIVTAA